MNFAIFSYTTIAGSAISCAILAWLGHRAYQLEPHLLSDPDGLLHFIRSQSHFILLVVLGFAALYIFSMYLTKPRRPRL
jgi:hypothetical protein